MPSSIYIAVILIDPSIADKIQRRAGGGCTADEVREAFVLRMDADLHWEDHPDHGQRVVGTGFTFAGREIAAALLPSQTEDGLWVLKTARPM